MQQPDEPTTSGLDRARELIREAEETQAPFLDLGNLGLREVPDEVRGLRWLQGISLAGYFYDPALAAYNTSAHEVADNAISALPPWISELRSLRFLAVDGPLNMATANGLTQLQNLELRGQNPVTSVDALAQLVNLRSLVIDRAIDPALPLAVGNLSNLEDLALINCSTLTNVDGLAGLRGLKHLTLYICLNLQDLRGLSALTGLESIFLGPPTSMLSLDGIARLSRLRSFVIQVSCRSLSDASALGSLTALQTLRLSDCAAFRDLGVIARLSDLRHLDLSSCKHLSNLEVAKGLHSLRFLRLSGCENLQDLGILAGLTELRELHLSDCTALRDIAGIAGLTELRRLSLQGSTELLDVNALAELENLQSLSLRGNRALTHAGDLGRLTNLECLNLSECGHLTDLSWFKGLTALKSLRMEKHSGLLNTKYLAPLKHLQHLSLAASSRLENVDGLSSLACLETLYLNGCVALTNIDGLLGLQRLRVLQLERCESLRRLPRFLLSLPSLTELRLFNSGIEDIPRVLLGVKKGDNCFPAIQAHFQALEQGVALDRELKLIVLGNGRVGKTSLCRRVIEGRFDPQERSTHGVRFWDWELKTEADPEKSVQVNVWDFGGQDIYYGTHAVFHRGRAVFLIVWDEETEARPEFHDEESDLTHRNYPLKYWIDYVNDVSPGSPIVLVQAKCASARSHQPKKGTLGLPRNVDVMECWFRADEEDARRGNHRQLTELLEDAAQSVLGSREAQRIGTGRWGVKQQVRAMVKAGAPKTVSRDDFIALCRNHGVEGEESVEQLLLFLHNCGVLYYQPDHFDRLVVLDQRWAADAIYSVLDRRGAFQHVRDRGGTFTEDLLTKVCWRDRTVQDRRVFLEMMRACGISFRLRTDETGQPVYLAPELAPPKDRVANRIAWPPDGEALVWRYEYDFLNPEKIRRAMCLVGGKYRDAATYWQDGFYLPLNDLHSQALVEAEYWVGGAASRGRIAIQARGSRCWEVLLLMREVFEGPRKVWEHRPPPREAAAVTVSLEGRDYVPLEDVRQALEAGNPRVRTEGGEWTEVSKYERFTYTEPEGPCPFPGEVPESWSMPLAEPTSVKLTEAGRMGSKNHTAKHLVHLEAQISTQLDKLHKFEQEVGITADPGRRFEYSEKIKTEVLPTIKRYEEQYARLIAPYVSPEMLPEREAESLARDLMTAAAAVQEDEMSSSVPPDVREALEEILAILTSKSKDSWGKIKLSIPLIPCVLAWEMGDRPKGLMQAAWQGFRDAASKHFR